MQSKGIGTIAPEREGHQSGAERRRSHPRHTAPLGGRLSDPLVEARQKTADFRLIAVEIERQPSPPEVFQIVCVGQLSA